MMPPEQSAVAAEWSARRAHARPLWIEGFGSNPDHTAVDGPPELVSVVLPTRDRGRLTRSAIESVMAQTWPHWELLVVDDGSSDDTVLIAELLAGRDQRIRVVRSDHRGASAARNRGLSLINGAFVAFLDSDEQWEPDFLRAMVAQLNGTAAEVAYANVRGLIGGGARFRSPHVRLPELLLKPLLDLSSVVLRRDLLDRVGPFDESLPRGGEYDFLIRTAQVARLQYTPIVGRVTAVHPQPYERIMSTESDDWIEVVQTRHEVDWIAQERRFRVPNTASYVVPIAEDADRAIAALERARRDDPRRWEAVFIDYSPGEAAATVLAPIVEATPELTYLRMPVPVTFEHAATLGFARTHGTSITLVSSDGSERIVTAAEVIAERRVRPQEPR